MKWNWRTEAGRRTHCVCGHDMAGATIWEHLVTGARFVACPACGREAVFNRSIQLDSVQCMLATALPLYMGPADRREHEHQQLFHEATRPEGTPINWLASA